MTTMNKLCCDVNFRWLRRHFPENAHGLVAQIHAGERLCDVLRRAESWRLEEQIAADAYDAEAARFEADH